MVGSGSTSKVELITGEDPVKKRGPTNWQESGPALCIFLEHRFRVGAGRFEFSAYTLLEHGGDFTAAAKALAFMWAKWWRISKIRKPVPGIWTALRRVPRF